jgi:hypothetical protein
MSTQENITVRDFAIGVLSVTAVILLTALLVGHAVLPRQAMAFAQSASGGGYLVTTSQLDDTAELLLILNTKTQQLNVYGFDVDTARIVPLQPPLDLERLGRDALRSIRADRQGDRGSEPVDGRTRRRGRGRR